MKQTAVLVLAASCLISACQAKQHAALSSNNTSQLLKNKSSKQVELEYNSEQTQLNQKQKQRLAGALKDIKHGKDYSAVVLVGPDKSNQKPKQLQHSAQIGRLIAEDLSNKLDSVQIYYLPQLQDKHIAVKLVEKNHHTA